MKKKGRKITKSASDESGTSKTYFIKDSNGRLEVELKISIKIPECENINLSANNLRYYQTESTMKLYLSLTGVQNISHSQIKINFNRKSFELVVCNLENVNYHLSLPNLMNTIIPNRCKHIIRKDKIIIVLAKELPCFWRSLQEIVSKLEWMEEYATLIADLTPLQDQSELFAFCDEMWVKVCLIEERNHCCLRPPPKLAELIPALKKNPSFSSYDSAINFYRIELKKTPKNDALYMILGTCLLEKQVHEKTSQVKTQLAESIDEVPSSSPQEVPKKVKKQSIEKMPSPPKEAIQTQASKEKMLIMSAESKKAEGNVYYKSGKFSLAIKAYREAIKLWPKCPVYYTNCSASYIMIGSYVEGLDMAEKAIDIDNKFVKGYIRKAKCHIGLGQTTQASKALSKAKEIGPRNDEIELSIVRNQIVESNVMIGKEALSNLNYSLAATSFEAASNIATGNHLILFHCVESLVFSDQLDKAKEKAEKLLLKKVDKDIAYCMLGLCAFFRDDKVTALLNFNKSISINSHSSKTQSYLKMVKDIYLYKEKGNKAFGNHEFDKALEWYLMALEIEPRNKNVCAKLHYNIALVRLKHQNTVEAIRSLTFAIELNKNYVKAYLKRADLYKVQGKVAEAIQDYERLYQLEPTEQMGRLLQEARLFLRTVGRKNYYKVLGLDRSATIDDIKKSYKSLALKHHPDKHDELTDKKENEKIFKEIAEAYTVLKDPRLKYKYDSGYLEGEERDFMDIVKMEIFAHLFKNMYTNKTKDDFNSDDDDYEYEDSDSDDDDDDSCDCCVDEDEDHCYI